MDEFNEILAFLENLEKNKTENKIEESFLMEKIPHTQHIQELPHELQVQPSISNSEDSGFDINRLEQAMRNELIKEHNRSNNYEKTYISVSDLISCPKKVYFQCKKYNIDLQNTFKFSYLHLIKKVGNLVHKIVQELYKFDEIEKTVISKKYNVKGRVDAIKGNTLYELKTMDNEKFENKYELTHYHQGLIYSYILNNDYNYKIKNISIVYIGRNLKTVFPFNNLPLNDSIAESFLNKSFIISDSLKKNTLPREENTSDCTFCPYKKYCKENIENIKPKSKFIL